MRALLDPNLPSIDKLSPPVILPSSHCLLPFSGSSSLPSTHHYARPLSLPTYCSIHKIFTPKLLSPFHTMPQAQPRPQASTTHKQSIKIFTSLNFHSSFYGSTFSRFYDFTILRFYSKAANETPPHQRTISLQKANSPKGQSLPDHSCKQRSVNQSNFSPHAPLSNHAPNRTRIRQNQPSPIPQTLPDYTKRTQSLPSSPFILLHR